MLPTIRRRLPASLAFHVDITEALNSAKKKRKKSDSYNHFLSRFQSNKGKKCFDFIVARSVSLVACWIWQSQIKQKHLVASNSFSLLSELGDSQQFAVNKRRVSLIVTDESSPLRLFPFRAKLSFARQTKQNLSLIATYRQARFSIQRHCRNFHFTFRQNEDACWLEEENEHTANKAHSTWIEWSEQSNSKPGLVPWHGNYSWVAIASFDGETWETTTTTRHES